MNITPENKIKILEYKLAFEQEIQVNKEFEEGNSDLSYRLSFFRKQLEENDKNKISDFDAIFMQNKNVTPQNENSFELDHHKDIQKPSNKNTNIKPWLKKTYRQIAKSTHPDMLIGIKSNKIKEKFLNYYRIAQNAYENNIAADIIMVATDLDIYVDNEIVASEIKIPFEEKIKRIVDIKKRIGWQWFHVPDTNKNAELKKILSNLGFNFTDDLIKVVNSKKPKRKVGQKPQKLKRFNYRRP